MRSYSLHYLQTTIKTMNTKALRQKILDLAIHGKLVPQDPNDEPASVLLQRIKAEKERLIKEGKIKRAKKSKATCDKPHYPYELPEGWVWTTLGEITSIIGDGLHGTPQYDIFGNYFFINGNNLVNRTIVIKEGTKKVSDDEYVKYRKPLNERTILVSINGTIGNVGTYNGEKIILGKSACYFNLLPDISKSYICNIIESDYFRKYAFKSATGSTIKNVPLKAINDFYIPLPPLQEQMRIVESIEHRLSFVGYIELDKEILQETIKKAKSKILDLAIHGKLVPQDPTDEPASELLKRINPKAEIACDNGQYEKLPKGWAVVKVGNAAEYINGRAFKPEEWESIGLPIVRIQNLNDADAHYNRTSVAHEQKYLIKDGDLLFAWAASLGTYIWTGGDAWLNQHIFKVKPYSFIYKSYLFYTFQAMISEFYRNSHGSGMVHITKKQFEEITLWLPPLSEQCRIVESLELTFNMLDSIAENI